jgi:glycosyltransferase involved in cell wall biosynthesis
MVSPGGAEKVVLELHKIWPDAPIYTAAYDPEKFPEFKGADVRPTWMNRLPIAKRRHQLFSLVRAWAFKSLDLSEYDLVISSSSAESKYIKTGKNTLHICYCHTPIRYYWSDYEWYRSNFPIKSLRWLVWLVLPIIIGPLRRMDYKAAQKVDLYVANSQNIRRRIKKYYNRDSTVIYPPVNLQGFKPKTKVGGEYFLIVGRQVAYKRLDLAVDAFNDLGLPLHVSGTGEEIAVQKARAKPNVKFLGRVPDVDIAGLYRGARAFIFPPEEDFGIVPVEAMACGVPVIAYGKGGALETVVEGKTGLFFGDQTVTALKSAIQKFKDEDFDPATIRAQAEKFDESIFTKKIKKLVESNLEIRQK